MLLYALFNHPRLNSGCPGPESSILVSSRWDCFISSQVTYHWSEPCNRTGEVHPVGPFHSLDIWKNHLASVAFCRNSGVYNVQNGAVSRHCTIYCAERRFRWSSTCSILVSLCMWSILDILCNPVMILNASFCTRCILPMLVSLAFMLQTGAA